MRPVEPRGTSWPLSSSSFTTVCSGGRPAVRGSERRSSGVAMVAHPTSVEPYRLNRLSPNSSIHRVARPAGMADPLSGTTSSDEVS